MPPSNNYTTRPNRLEHYVPVAERLKAFYAAFPEGRINTVVLTDDRESGYCLVRAEVYRKADDAQPAATGHSNDVRGEGNRQVTDANHLELAETGAVGRALMLLGFEAQRVPAAKPAGEQFPTVNVPGVRPVVRPRPPDEAPPPNTLPRTPDEEHRKLDALIRGVAAARHRTEAHIQDHVRRKYETDSKWTDLSLAIKRELLETLQQTKPTAPTSAA